MATASVSTGGDTLATISLAGLDLTHSIQVVGLYDTAIRTITLEARDVDGVSVSASATSTQPLGLGGGNAMGLFAGDNGNFHTVAGNIGGSAATGTSRPATPGVFSGTIGLFRIWEGIDLAATAASYSGLVNTANRADDPRPNVIVIFTDDHGYADLGIQGQDPDVATLTPHIDRIGAEEVRLTNGYINSYWKNFERNDALGTAPLGIRQTEPGHRLDIQSDFAVSFIERNADRPFLCYLSYYAPPFP